MSRPNPIQPSASGSDTRPGAIGRLVLAQLVYLALFLLLDWLTRRFEILPGVVAWYPPAGLTFACLLVFGVRFVPAAIAGSLLSSLLLYQLQQPAAALVLWAGFVAAAYAAAATLLRRRLRIDIGLQHVRDVFWLTLLAALVAALLSVVSVSGALSSGDVPAARGLQAAIHWWIGELVGVLALTPVLLIHVMPHVSRFVYGRADPPAALSALPLSVWHGAGQAVSLSVVLYLAFGVPELREFQPLYLLAVPLTWIALHGGIFEVSIGIASLNFATTYALWTFGFDVIEIGELQLFMLVISTAGLLTGVVVSQRRLFEAALASSGQRYQGLFEDSPISLWEEDFSAVKERLDAHRRAGVTDFEAHFAAHPEEALELASLVRILDANRAAVRLYGARDKHELMRSLKELLGDEAVAHFRDELICMARGGTTYSWEGTDRKLSGEPIHVSMSWSVAPGYEGSLAKVIVSVIDIGDRLRAEAEILSLSRFPGENPNPILRFATDGGVLYANKASQAMLQHWSAEGRVQLPEALRTRMAQAIQSRREQEIEVELAGLTYLCLLVPVPDEGYVNLYARDITARRQSEAARERSESLFRALFELSPEAILLIDPHDPQGAWRILDCNLQACAMNGYSRDELIGQSIDIFHVSPGTPAERAAQLEQLRTTRVISREGLHRHKNGTIFPIEYSSALVNISGRELMIGIDRDISGRKQDEDRMRRHLERLTALSDIDRAISSSFSLKISLGIVLDHTLSQLSVDAALVLLLDPVTNTLSYAAGRGFRTTAFEQSRGLRLGEGYAGRAAVEQRGFHIANLGIQQDNPRLAGALPAEGFVSYHVVPMIVKGKILGTLEVFHRSMLNPDEEWLGFLHTLAGQAAIAVDNATLFENLQRSNSELGLAYDATIEGWSRALDLRDKETEGHTQRVTELTLRLAELCGLRDEQLVHVRRGALLHDIGKMGVPDEILLKPGPLSDDEWAIMRTHPQLAYHMLSSIRHLQPALEIPYCHHERWDGSGYPRGLRGDQIPVTARIFAVIDVWDALTSDRPYRPAWSEDQALEHIRAQAGTHFDPQVVRVCLESRLLTRRKHD